MVRGKKTVHFHGGVLAGDAITSKVDSFYFVFLNSAGAMLLFWGMVPGGIYVGIGRVCCGTKTVHFSWTVCPESSDHCQN